MKLKLLKTELKLHSRCFPADSNKSNKSLVFLASSNTDGKDRTCSKITSFKRWRKKPTGYRDLNSQLFNWGSQEHQVSLTHTHKVQPVIHIWSSRVCLACSPAETLMMENIGSSFHLARLEYVDHLQSRLRPALDSLSLSSSLIL